MAIEIAADAVEPGFVRGPEDGDLAECLARSAEAHEPGVASEVVGTGKRHWHRRSQAGAEADGSANAEVGTKRLGVAKRERDADLGRKCRVGGREGEAEVAAGDQPLCLEDLGIEGCDLRPVEPQCLDLSAPPPDERAAQRRAGGSGGDDLPAASSNKQAGNNQTGRDQQQRDPRLGLGKHQPGGDPAAKGDHCPGRKLGPFGLKPFFRTCEERSGLPVRRSRCVSRGSGHVHAASLCEGKRSGGNEERGKRA
jgi:hypothetical protein